MVPALAIALAATVLLMVFWRRHLGALLQVGALLAAVLVMVLLQDAGYLPTGDARPTATRGMP